MEDRVFLSYMYYSLHILFISASIHFIFTVRVLALFMVMKIKGKHLHLQICVPYILRHGFSGGHFVRHPKHLLQ